jgi:hypothetical protein
MVRCTITHQKQSLVCGISFVSILRSNVGYSLSGGEHGNAFRVCRWVRGRPAGTVSGLVRNSPARHVKHSKGRTSQPCLLTSMTTTNEVRTTAPGNPGCRRAVSVRISKPFASSELLSSCVCGDLEGLPVGRPASVAALSLRAGSLFLGCSRASTFSTGVLLGLGRTSGWLFSLLSFLMLQFAL